VAQTQPTIVDADEDLMIQVLVNLLDNAITHTPASGSIAIGCCSSPAAALIWVQDTGPGIPPELRERVFDRFFRIDTGRTRAIGGAGLGLTICRALVEAQNGSIRAVQSQIPGTRIEITLPAIVGDTP
jgi:signal transduction histidine kinase